VIEDEADVSDVILRVESVPERELPDVVDREDDPGRQQQPPQIGGRGEAPQAGSGPKQEHGARDEKDDPPLPRKRLREGREDGVRLVPDRQLDRRIGGNGWDPRGAVGAGLPRVVRAESECSAAQENRRRRVVVLRDDQQLALLRPAVAGRREIEHARLFPIPCGS